MRNPGAPKPPLATQPDQMLPTFFSPSHRSLLYAHAFPNPPSYRFVSFVDHSLPSASSLTALSFPTPPPPETLTDMAKDVKTP